MKNNKTIIACAIACGVFSISNAAEFSVGEVTVAPYVRIVGGVNYVNNSYKAGIAGNKVEIASNQWGTSYIGTAMSIQLNDEWQGISNLEIGFGTDTGETNDIDSLFNRQANIGVKSADYGQLTLGTHLLIAQDIIDMDPMNFQSIGINTLVNGANDGTAENSLIYRSPQLYGFSVAYMHQFGGEVGNSERSRSDGISLSYQYDGLHIRSIYQERADYYGRYTGGEYYGLGTQGQWLYVQSTIFAGSYDFGDAKVFAGYQKVEAPDSGYGLDYTFDDEAEMVWVGVNYNISKKLKANAAIYQSSKSYSDKESDLYAVGLTYEFNDHFAFYTTLGNISNNKVSSDLIGDVGASNHALSYLEWSCEDTTDCNGASQFGGYTGFVFKM